MKRIEDKDEVLESFSAFLGQFSAPTLEYEFITNGAFGYMSYDAVRFFETISLQTVKNGIPELFYQVFQIIIAIDLFKNELYIFEHNPEGLLPSRLEEVKRVLRYQGYGTYPFRLTGAESSNLTDAAYLQMVNQGIDHCHRGDVFQIVLSRRFEHTFQGDDFNVYRALRSINPSPYLFYFDLGSFKLFGSSPEAQIEIHSNKASIYPIAGTFKRTGNREEDEQKAKELARDPKENAEHVMLVDLARNDLSKHGSGIEVEVFKEVQYFSHVIHLVSKVTANLNPEQSALQLAADTFPAGTLSGAPKHRAMQLINAYENSAREHYGGAVGFVGFNGEFNHAIMIRTFLSRGNTLRFQAGAGIVSKSVPENELQEVHNKVAALRKALVSAENIVFE
jgi:anthranilate synthase component 1